MILKTPQHRQASKPVIYGILLGAAGLGLSACSTATEPEKPAEQGRGAIEHARQLVAAPALERLDRRVPGMRRASAEEVKAHFDRLARSRELARLEESKPVDRDAILTKLAASPNRTERSALAQTYVQSLAQLDAPARATAVARLNETLAAKAGGSR
jgi:hypothetical protein